MKKIFNLLKGKSKDFSFKKFLLLFGSAFIVNLFSNFLGSTLLIISLLYLVTKGIVPKIKNIGTKLTNFIKQKYNKLKELKPNKKEKKLTLFKSKKKNEEIEEVEQITKTDEEIEEVTKIKKEKKYIPNFIKNFKLLSTDKFKSNLKVKRDINGCKIVNGSYRIKGNKIIDNKIDLYTFEPIIENETQYLHKTYVKTK